MKKPMIYAIALFSFVALAVQAHALSITPTTGVSNVSRWSGPENSQNDINAILDDLLPSGVAELYKQESSLKTDAGTVYPGPESGLLAGSYETAFRNTEEDPSNATITYTGGAVVGSPAFLLVKDGKNDPGWYLFGLTGLGWNGTDELALTDFWPGAGSISHVSLYGTSTPVPEPGTMLLLGSGLLGIAGFARMRTKKS